MVRLADVLPAAAVFEIDEDAVGELLRRGVDRPVAERLVGHYGPERVLRQVRNFDRVRPRTVVGQSSRGGLCDTMRKSA